MTRHRQVKQVRLSRVIHDGCIIPSLGAPTAGQRPAGEGANIDRRLVPYTRDAMRTKSRIEFIYLYICINRRHGPHARGIGTLALVNSLQQKLISLRKQT